MDKNDCELHSVKAFSLLNENKIDEAKKILQKGLLIDPLNVDLLFNMALLYEKNHDIYYAVELYEKALKYSNDDNEKAKCIDALKNIEKLNSKPNKNIAYSYEAKIKGSLFNVKYYWIDLLSRKKLLEIVIDHINNKSINILEIECEEGTIGRGLAEIGFNVNATTSKKEELYKNNVFEEMKQLHISRYRENKFHYSYEHFSIEDILKMKEYATILFMPKDFEVFLKEGSEKILLKVLSLAKKTQQLFLHIPKTPFYQEEISKEIIEEKLEEGLEKEGYQMQCLYSEDNKRNSYINKVFHINREKKANSGFCIPSGLNVLKSNSNIFYLDIDKCVNIYNFKYDEWEVLTVLFNQYQYDSNLDYEKSVLHKHYNNFRPKNLGEAIFGIGNDADYPLNKGWPSLPWSFGNLMIKKEASKNELGGLQLFGPNTLDFGKKELVRAISSFINIRNNGYIPEIFPDGYIKGYFLRKKDDYRFIIQGGQHRISALTALSYKTIKAKFHPINVRNKVVDINRVENWENVKNGLYSKDVAVKVFNAFFSTRGDIELFENY